MRTSSRLRRKLIREACRPVLRKAGVGPGLEPCCVPETPHGGGGMYDTGDPGPPC